MKLMAGIGVGAVMVLLAQWAVPHLPRAVSDIGVCDAPSGAMDAIQYQEMFVPKLRDLKFSCIPLLYTPCHASLCTKFTAIDAEDKHVIGYVWRDVWNKPQSALCSPDGGKEGSFYGECPVGTPVKTVYRCPWCEPDFNARPDLRGKHASKSD